MALLYIKRKKQSTIYLFSVIYHFPVFNVNYLLPYLPVYMEDATRKYPVMIRAERKGELRCQDNDIVIATLNEQVYFQHCKSHGMQRTPTQPESVESSYTVVMTCYFTQQKGSYFLREGIHKIVIDFASINDFDLATKRAVADRKLIRMKTITGQNQTL